MENTDRLGPSGRGAGRDLFGRIGVDNPLKPLQAASCTYRIALGSRAGRKPSTYY